MNTGPVTAEMIRNARSLVGPASTNPHFDWMEWYAKQAIEVNKMLAADPVREALVEAQRLAKETRSVVQLLVSADMDGMSLREVVATVPSGMRVQLVEMETDKLAYPIRLELPEAALRLAKIKELSTSSNTCPVCGRIIWHGGTF